MRATFDSSDYVDPYEIDWKQIFDDLKNEGLSPYNVGILIGKSGSTVQRWSEGKEPRKSVADAILTIHENWCGTTTTAIRILTAESV